MRINVQLGGGDGGDGADEDDGRRVLVDVEARHLRLLLQLLEVLAAAADEPADLRGLDGHPLDHKLEHLARGIDLLLRRPNNDNGRARLLDLDAVKTADRKRALGTLS